MQFSDLGHFFHASFELFLAAFDDFVSCCEQGYVLQNDGLAEVFIFEDGGSVLDLQVSFHPLELDFFAAYKLSMLRRILDCLTTSTVI